MPAYTIPLSPEFASAMEWHGGRYLVSEILCRHIVADDDDQNPRIELEEHEAWELSQAWEDEGPLACGSDELNSVISDFIGRIVYGKNMTTKETSIGSAIQIAIDRNIIDRRAVDANFKRRASAAFKRNIDEPGDCRGDVLLLLGISVGEAYVSRAPGWIPEVQRIGCLIADAMATV
jgi:hypothetical protein